MDYQSVTDELIEVLSKQGVAIRTDAMGSSGGGLCVLKNEKIFFLDTELSSFESAVSSARAVMCVIGDLDSIYLRPAVRDFIDKYGTNE